MIKMKDLLIYFGDSKFFYLLCTEILRPFRSVLIIEIDFAVELKMCIGMGDFT